jgi:hypothetical protein
MGDEMEEGGIPYEEQCIHIYPYTLSLSFLTSNWSVIYIGTIPRGGKNYQPLWCFSGPTLITIQGPQILDSFNLLFCF